MITSIYTFDFKDSFEDFLQKTKGKERLAELINNDGYSIDFSNDNISIIVEDMPHISDVIVISNLYDDIEESLTIALNDIFYKYANETTTNFFKELGWEDLRILRAEHELFIDRFKIGDFADFDFEAEKEELLQEARILSTMM